MASREKHKVTGRYMHGTTVSGYHIVSNKDNKQRKVTREQFIFLLGRGDIANCRGQLYGNQVIIRGTGGVNIEDLPVFDERTGVIRGSENVSNVRPKDGDMTKVLGQLIITARLMNGRNNIGFEIRNHGGKVARLPRNKVIELASQKMIANAVVQNLTKDGVTKKLLRGAGMSLRDLPAIQVDLEGNNQTG